MKGAEVPRGTTPDSRRDEMLRLRHQELWTLQKIGDRFGMTRERVRQIIGNTGLVVETQASLLDARMEQILRLWRKGRNFAQIGRMVGLPGHAIATLGLPRNFAPIPHGTSNGYQFHGCRCPECKLASAKRTVDRNDKLRKRGLCVHCRASSPDHWLCQRCRETSNRKLREKKAGMRRMREVAHGGD